MSDFNYQEYLRNNPLLQEEVKEEQLITEAEDKNVEEVMGIDRKGNKKPDVKMSKAAKAKQDAKGVKEEEIQEGIPQGSEIADYVEGMFNSDVVEKEGFQSDIWRKEQYASNDYKEGSVFLDLVDHLKSVGGKDVLEGNPDIHLELLSNDDIQWSADVTLDENLAEEEIQEEVPSSKMKVSELKAKIKEDIISLLQEEEEEDVEAEIEDEVDVDIDTEEPAVDAVSGGDEGLSADEKEIQDSLKLAYDNAVAIGDTKLADQIGNSITFFTRTHVVER